MFLALLVVTFLVATVVSMIVMQAFLAPVDQILSRIIADEISGAWRRYLMFAMYVVGVSSGVRIWELERYITKPPDPEAQIVPLTAGRWAFRIAPRLRPSSMPTSRRNGVCET